MFIFWRCCLFHFSLLYPTLRLTRSLSILFCATKNSINYIFWKYDDLSNLFAEIILKRNIINPNLPKNIKLFIYTTKIKWPTIRRIFSYHKWITLSILLLKSKNKALFDKNEKFKINILTFILKTYNLHGSMLYLKIFLWIS